MELQNNKMSALDELDLMLIKELERDARLSYHKVASKLSTSHSTVRRRVNRLLDQGIITIAALPIYAALGLKTSLVLGINAPPGMVDALAKQFASVESIKYLWVTAGRYDMLAVALYGSPEDYLTSFPKEIGDVPENIRIETMESVKLTKGIWHHHVDDFVDNSNSSIIPTKLDLAVIKELEKAPRASATQIACEIGASVFSVRTSLHKLNAEGIMRVRCIPNPAVFGSSVMGVTLIQANPTKLKALTDILARHSSVDVVSLIFGAFNCLIWTSFPTSEALYDFLHRELGNMPGVVNYENMIALRMEKR